MAKRRRSFVYRVFRDIFLGLFFGLFVVPYAVGYLGYFTSFGGVEEQIWLDAAIHHIQCLKETCKDDPQLQDVLDYTIQRYNRIGPFDVSVSCCNWWPLKMDYVVLGYNNPFVPGVTLDISVLTDYELHAGAMTLVHEALHDYPPYAGHSHVYPVLDKLEAYYVPSRPNCKRPRFGGLETDR